MSASPSIIYLKDYQQPNFWIKKTELTFDLFDDHAIVHSVLTIESNAEQVKQTGNTLILHGQDMELQALVLNGKTLLPQEYTVEEESLTIANVPASAILECTTRIKPQENTSLEGLYKSQKMFCTQCEAEGFRKITYYLDRPDVMSEFTTLIRADKSAYPVLLSNGNLVDSGELDGGRHWTKWHDPFAKPCYLFALVAGDLVAIDDRFTTMSGRDVLLRIFVEEKDKDKCDHAMTSLKNSMRWDEEVYGREYDLDIFMIVAVDDFNMGAMENKGLNIFNTSCVLAKQETTTDAGFQRVEAVVAHEYFHNWSGNRVTCRDWFQLSLKEGFTVFRDAEFSADMGSKTVKRVEDVSMLRSMQFSEDAGPMAHPVQPSSFIEISNFYTLTIYEKGAEVVRMIRTLIGADLFRKGSDLYFDRHDGQAVTIDDFIAAMADVSGRDFTQFMHWYRQAGTPSLTVSGTYDEDAQTYTLTVKQYCAPTPEAQEKAPFHIPVTMGLLGDAGSLPLYLEGVSNTESSDNTQCVLEITEAEQRFVFNQVKERPVPSLLREFSAPVKLKYRYSTEDLLRIMNVDSDGFCRWDACQQLVINEIQRVMAALVSDPAPAINSDLVEAYRGLLGSDSSDLAIVDPAMVALMLALPSESYLAEQTTVADVDAIHLARNHVQRKIAQALSAEFSAVYKRLSADTTLQTYSADAQSIAGRALKNTCLHYLMIQAKPEAIELCQQQFTHANNMTDELAAFTAIVHSSKPALASLKEEVIASFFAKWQHEPLVVNLWFSVQASSPVPDNLKHVEALMAHKAFDVKNPNKLRAVIASFAMRNVINFHDKSGSGYAFLADQILLLNHQNPQIAARLLTPLTKWKRYDEKRQQIMKSQLKRISEEPKLSKDVYEVVIKSLV